MPMKFLLLGGGDSWFFFWKGGVEVPVLFLWAWGLFRFFERGETTPTPKISALLRKRPVLLKVNFVLTKDRNGVVKYTGRGLVVKRPGVLSKVQLLTLVLGVGVFSLLPNFRSPKTLQRLQAGQETHRGDPGPRQRVQRPLETQLRSPCSRSLVAGDAVRG